MSNCRATHAFGFNGFVSLVRPSNDACRLFLWKDIIPELITK